jgi:hypothetical protein
LIFKLILPAPRWLRRGYAQFEQLIRAAEASVVLLEGSRRGLAGRKPSRYGRTGTPTSAKFMECVALRGVEW